MSMRGTNTSATNTDRDASEQKASNRLAVVLAAGIQNLHVSSIPTAGKTVAALVDTERGGFSKAAKETFDLGRAFSLSSGVLSIDMPKRSDRDEAARGLLGLDPGAKKDTPRARGKAAKRVKGEKAPVRPPFVEIRVLTPEQIDEMPAECLMLLPNIEVNRKSFPQFIVETDTSSIVLQGCTVNTHVRVGLKLPAADVKHSESATLKQITGVNGKPIEVVMTVHFSETDEQVRNEDMQMPVDMLRGLKKIKYEAGEEVDLGDRGSLFQNKPDQDSMTQILRTEKPVSTVETLGGVQARALCAAEAEFSFKFNFTPAKDLQSSSTDTPFYLRFRIVNLDLVVQTEPFRLTAKIDETRPPALDRKMSLPKWDLPAPAYYPPNAIAKLHAAEANLENVLQNVLKNALSMGDMKASVEKALTHVDNMRNALKELQEDVEVVVLDAHELFQPMALGAESGAPSTVTDAHVVNSPQPP